MISSSPLRYPGGKQVISPALARLMRLNHCEGAIYGEPYAGGAGAALNLLFSGYARKILINDADPAIAAMWSAIVSAPKEFAKRILEVPLDVQEWRNQKAIYQNPRSKADLELGFAAFYLNRVNRSGIIKNAGPIGGLEQDGKWKIDARFNREQLADRILRIGRYSNRVSVTSLDALDFLERLSRARPAFVYLDPPYYIKGKELYLNHYSPQDHAQLSSYLKTWNGAKWIMSYDDVPEIHSLYQELRKVRFQLSYSVTNRKAGAELLILCKGLKIPQSWRQNLPPLRNIQ